MKTSALILFSLAAAGTLACGSLGDPGKKPVLATITGELQNPNPQSFTVSPSSAGGTRVAVVWLGQSNHYGVAEDLPVQPVFPSRFQLALSDPPPDDVVLTAAKVAKEPAATPPQPGPSPTPAPPSGGGTKPKDLDSNVGSWPADFGLAVGSVVAYDDQNGNGHLDLVDEGATAYVDRILGANESLLLFYFQGTFPPNVILNDGVSVSAFADMSGAGPKTGYNLLYLKECVSTATDLGGGSPTPPPPACTPAAQWLPLAGTIYELPLTADPTWGNLMCRKGTSELGGGSGSSNAQPSSPGSTGSGAPSPGTDAGAAEGGAGAPDPSLPAASDPKLQCAADGRSFTYDCHATAPPPAPKLCGGPQISEVGCGAWIRPSPPPSNWPCPSP